MHYTDDVSVKKNINWNAIVLDKSKYKNLFKIIDNLNYLKNKNLDYFDGIEKTIFLYDDSKNNLIENNTDKLYLFDFVFKNLFTLNDLHRLLLFIKNDSSKNVDQDCITLDFDDPCPDCLPAGEENKKFFSNKKVLINKSGNGKPCGLLMKEVECKIPNCPVDCELNNDWSEWSKCNNKCGKNNNFRTRIKNIKTYPKFNGKKCPTIEERSETELCDDIDCPKWKIDDWGDCKPKNKCGIGIKNRNVKCTNHLGNSVDESNCLEDKPVSEKECNVMCKWIKNNQWSDCSQECGVGYQSREYICESGIDKDCKDRKPVNENRKCVIKACPKWKTGEWSEIPKCNKTGSFVQRRSLSCTDNDQIVDDNKCKDQKPVIEKKVNVKKCEWIIDTNENNWSKCPECGDNEYRYRDLICESSNVSDCGDKKKTTKREM